jgi:MSHA pilin protein MshC
MCAPFKFSQSTKKMRGFSMIELIMVMILMGILSAVLMSKFSSRIEFDARGFFDQSIDMIRYAQKMAIAQRRDVYVQVDAGSGHICLTFNAEDTAGCIAANTSSANQVLNPADQQWYKRTAPTGVSFSGSLSFLFSALGRPSFATTQTLTISSTGPVVTGVITVEKETGYVH